MISAYGLHQGRRLFSWGSGSGEDLDQRQEKLVDEAVEETFPASDPVSVKITK